MSQRAHFTYRGGDQVARVGDQLFDRNISTLVTDPAVIAALDAHGEFQREHPAQDLEIQPAAEEIEPVAPPASK